MLKIRKIDVLDVACIIISVVLLVVSPSIYMLRNLENVYIAGSIFLMVSLFLVLLKVRHYKLKRYQIIFMAALILIDTLLFWISGADSGTGYYILGFGFIYFAFLSFILDTDNRYDTLLEVVVLVITALAIISLFFWLFGSLFHIIQSTDYIRIDWGGVYRVKNYYNIYFEPQNTLFNAGEINIKVRNCAFFAEGPVCNFFFSTGLLLNEFYVVSKRKIIDIILLLAVFSTLTTSGIMVLLLYFFYKLMKIQTRRKIGKVFKFVFLVIALVSFLIIGLGALKDKLMTGSGIVRLSRFTAEFAAFRNNIIFGNGINSFTNGSSNSFAALLADGGILLWSMYYLPIFGKIAYKLFKRKEIDYFSLIFGFVFAITVVQYTLFTVFVVILMWKEFLEIILKHKVVNSK